MGLFGGFKGKLKGNKEKKTVEKRGGSEIVCVKYTVFSEFDQPTSIIFYFLIN